MKEPIFIFEGEDFGCYENLQDASRSLEAIDVINDIFRAYDSEGKLLKLSAKDKFDTVDISLAEDTPSHQIELKKKLILALKYYHEIGKLDSIDWLGDATLNDVVKEIVKFGYEK
jgi:hypothetical protein